MLSGGGAAPTLLQAVQGRGEREPPARGIGTDHELDDETARTVRVVKGQIGEGRLPVLPGDGLIPVAERATIELFAHGVSMAGQARDRKLEIFMSTRILILGRHSRESGNPGTFLDY